MTLLICGVTLFCLVHFIPSIGSPLKARMVNKLGENGYKGVFSLLLLGSFALMILGWRTTHPSYVYAPPVSLNGLAYLLIIAAFLLMTAASLKTRLRRLIRHPQLTGVALWAGGHLLLNGDSRAIVLFGGLGLWALLSIVAINRREGAWIKEEAPGASAEALLLGVTAAGTLAVVLIHPWISGVSAW